MELQLETRRKQQSLARLIEIQEREVLAVLSEKYQWRAPFCREGRIYGFTSENDVPTLIPEDTIATAKVGLHSIRDGQNEWPEFSFQEAVALRYRRLRQNCLIQSPINIAGIKIPDPHKGIVVIGRQVLSKRDQYGALHSYNIVRRLLGQYQFQGVRTESCNSPTRSLPHYRLDRPLALGIDDFLGFEAKREALNLFSCGRAYGLHPVVGLGSINRYSIETSQLLASMSTWIVAGCDAATAQECSRYLGGGFDPVRFYALPDNAFWIVSRVAGEDLKLYGEF